MSSLDRAKKKTTKIFFEEDKTMLLKEYLYDTKKDRFYKRYPYLEADYVLVTNDKKLREKYL